MFFFEIIGNQGSHNVIHAKTCGNKAENINLVTFSLCLHGSMTCLAVEAVFRYY